MRVEILDIALKDLKQIDKSEVIKIFHKIESLENFPKVSNIKKLVNYKPSYRLRVGNYRVLFDVDCEQIIVGRILHRSKSYE